MRPKQPRDALGRFISSARPSFKKEMVGYKGYNLKLRCTGQFQYRIGGSYETDDRIVLCVSGFHCCKDPLGPFTFYTPGVSRYSSVVVKDGIEDKETGKMVAKHIRIGNELDLDALEQLVQMRCQTKCTGIKPPEEDVHVWYRVVAEPGVNCHVLTADYSYLEPETDYRMYGLLITTGRNSVCRSEFAIAKGCNSIADTMRHGGHYVGGLALTLSSASAAITRGERSLAVCWDPGSAAIVKEYNSVAIASFGSYTVAEADNCVLVSYGGARVQGKNNLLVLVPVDFCDEYRRYTTVYLKPSTVLIMWNRLKKTWCMFRVGDNGLRANKEYTVEELYYKLILRRGNPYDKQ